MLCELIKIGSSYGIHIQRGVDELYWNWQKQGYILIKIHIIFPIRQEMIEKILQDYMNKSNPDVPVEDDDEKKSFRDK